MIREKLNSITPDYVTIGFGTAYIHTDRGLQYMDRLAQWKHITRVTDFGVFLFIPSMIVAFATLIAISISVVQSPPEPTAAQDPVNLLAIPGVNEFLPLEATLYILLALFIAAGAHELAHGVAMRAENVTVDEVGIVLLLGIPIAAYVMPDDDEFEQTWVRGKARILSAGIFANLLVFAITTLLFLLPGTGSPIDAFMAYFGGVLGEDLPTVSDVESLGIITNALFWTWFFNINLAFVNVLPVVTLDGSRVAALVTDYISVPIPESLQEHAVITVTTIGTVSVFVIAVFGPVLL